MNSSNVDFLCIDKTIHIINFRIRLYPSKLCDLKGSQEIENILPSINFKYDIKNENIKSSNIKSKIFVQNDKLVFDKKELKFIKFGQIEFCWESTFDDQIVIIMDIEVVDTIENAISFTNVKVYLLKSISGFQQYENFRKNESHIHRFLNKNIQGINADLKKVTDPVSLNFRKMDENKIRFVQKSSKIIYEEVISNFEHYDNISLEVKFRDQYIHLYPTDEYNIWTYENGKGINLPKNGFFEIYLITPSKFKYNKSNREKELRTMKSELYNIRNDSNSIVHVKLSNLINADMNSTYTSPLDNYQLLLNKTKYNEIIRKLDQKQLNALENINNNKILVITGYAGCGKTEVGVLAALLSNKQNYRLLVTSQTNKAIDNFLERLLDYKKKFPNIIDLKNIVRLRSIYNKIYNKKLRKYNLENIINNIRSKINRICNRDLPTLAEQEMQQEFKDIFTKEIVLSEIIPLTFDIVLSTYGKIISNRSFFRDNQNFYLNITDASSCIYFSQFILGSNKSNKWLILGEELQLLPQTVGDYVFKEDLVYPEDKQLYEAIRYDPQDLSHRRKFSPNSKKVYKLSILEFMLRMKDEDLDTNLSHIQLNTQYRIHPNIHSKLVAAFVKDNSDINYPNDIDFLDFSHLSSFTEQSNRIQYQNNRLSKNVIINNLIEKLGTLVNEINQDSSTRRISIGVGFDNIDSVRFAITQLSNIFEKIKINKFQKIIEFPIGKIDILISSIKNHQEREYDIFLFGITKANLKFSEEQIYTALTRTASYLFIFGPDFSEIRPKSMRKKIEKLV